MMKLMSLLSLMFLLSATGCSQKSAEQTITPTIAEYTQGKDYSAYKVATFAGGCFWCTEAAFERINGVVDVISGYSGGTTERPTYYQVGAGNTGHAEAIQIFYDPKVIDFKTLLKVFFVAHDPTQLNRQGPDIGSEYRSAIYYHNDEQKQMVDEYITALDASGKFENKIVTEVAAYDEFWVAEEYHQNYYELHPENGYVQRVSRPKVEKVKKTFATLLKPKYKK